MKINNSSLRKRFLQSMVLTGCAMVFGASVLLGCDRTNPDRKTFETLKASRVSATVEQTKHESLQVALSLKALQAQAALISTPSGAIRTLAGINEIHGFLMEQDGEVILIGSRNATVPLLHIDDLVVAVRNAYQVSGEYQGIIGCTIDPWVGQEDPWRIQHVTVFGMPNSRMAYRHVGIDYELKKISSGLMVLDRVPSVWGMIREASPICQQGRESQIDATHRFFFYPRYPEAPRFKQDKNGVIILRPVGVQLLTEREFLDQRGERTHGEKATPQAEQFAQQITDLLETNKIRNYSQLRNDFRVIEVAKLLRFKKVAPGFLRFLLYDYQLSEVSVPSYVGGIHREEHGEAVCENQITESHVPQGIQVSAKAQISGYHLSSRGGVEAKVKLSPRQFIEDEGGHLAELRRRVRSSRPDPTSLAWTIRD